MPTPCYISITGQTQGNITAGAFTADSVGNIYVQGHEDEMLVQEFLHNVTVPTDPQSGQPAGQRAHKPFIFTVALNKAVPLMYNALASGEMLPGTGFGNLAIPRVGQEVIVDFLNGDPDQPIIMGRTYHQENRTPGSLPGTKTQMTIRSKTYKGSGFNELKFDDATGKEQVYIHAQKNMNTEVLNNRTTDVINNHAETIGNNQMIAVTNNQIQTVGVNQIETVGSNQIIKVGSVQVETIGLVRALTVGVAYQTTVGGIMNTSVALMQSSQIGLHKSLRVGLGYDVKVGNNVTFTVGKTKKDDTGQTAIYSAGEHLELCCGKARLVLTKDGQIFLNGTKIHLQGKEQVNGDSLLINWNCAASKSPPKTPDEKQDTPDMREY